MDAVLSSFTKLKSVGYDTSSAKTTFVKNEGDIWDHYYFVASSTLFAVNKFCTGNVIVNLAGNYTNNPSMSWYDANSASVYYSTNGTSGISTRGTMFFINET